MSVGKGGRERLICDPAKQRPLPERVVLQSCVKVRPEAKPGNVPVHEGCPQRSGVTLGEAEGIPEGKLRSELGT